MQELSAILNVDMGESYGPYSIGNDAEVMKQITAANIACGFHGGDPTVIKKTVQLAKQYNVSVGAHPGFQDLRGFGRRMIGVEPAEVYDDIVYQLGALDAFLKIEKMEMTHISPHGKLDPLVSNNDEYAEVFIKAIKDYNPNLRLIIEANSLLCKKAKSSGLTVCPVGYPDLRYDSYGEIIIDKVKKSLDAKEIARQSLSIIKDHIVRAVDGKQFPIEAEVLCYHGDVPNAVEILKEVRKVFDDEGIKIISSKKKT